MPGIRQNEKRDMTAGKAAAGQQDAQDVGVGKNTQEAALRHSS